MENQHIEAVIFDLGGVLIDFDHTIAAKKISSFSNKSFLEIFNLFFDSPLTGLFEEGRILPLDFFLEVKKLLNLNLKYEDFLPIWNEIFFLTEKNKQVYHLAKQLKNNYKIGLISNINILHFDYLKKNFSIFDIFDSIITSFEVGVRKPNPLIYQKALRALETKPQRIFYTDDRQELIQEAKKLGFKSFCFKGIDKLKEDFLSVGIKV